LKDETFTTARSGEKSGEGEGIKPPPGFDLPQAPPPPKPTAAPPAPPGRDSAQNPGGKDPSPPQKLNSLPPRTGTKEENAGLSAHGKTLPSLLWCAVRQPKGMARCAVFSPPS